MTSSFCGVGKEPGASCSASLQSRKCVVTARQRREKDLIGSKIPKKPIQA
ncbi:hypothetical protein [Brevibacillus dissolubilis]|nr:hypothetical protein [Brevibacillus dissolubilis]